MSKHTCSNPACQKTYVVKHDEVDAGLCSFEWFEASNCKVPELIKFEEISFDS
jgi:hypothetical protein